MMTTADALERLKTAMRAEEPEELREVVSTVAGAGLPVRELYDEAREATAAKGQYVVSFRELMADQE